MKVKKFKILVLRVSKPQQILISPFTYTIKGIAPYIVPFHAFITFNLKIFLPRIFSVQYLFWLSWNFNLYQNLNDKDFF